jgi:hypothetical protein
MATVATLFGEWDEPDPKPARIWDEDADEHYYVLDAHRRPLRVSHHEWMAWCNSNPETLVAETDLGDGWRVITSFYGAVQPEEDKENTAPLFWTLVIMANCDDDSVDAYPTWDAAEAGHREVVERYKKQLGLA